MVRDERVTAQLEGEMGSTQAAGGAHPSYGCEADDPDGGGSGVEA